MTVDYAAPLTGEPLVVTSADGARIHTVSAGSGPPVVLAHGFAIDKDEWNVVGSALVARGHRVIAFDQRGHGLSTIGRAGVGSWQMAGDYAAVLAAHDVHSGVLAAHSMGGFVAVRFLLDSRDLVERHLVGALLMSTMAGDVARDNPQNKLQIPLLKSGLLGRMVRTDVVGRPFARTLMGDEPDDAMGAAFLRMFRAQHLRPLVPILEAMVREDRYADLAGIELPCTIVVGDSDRTTPPFHTDELAAGIVGSRLVRVPRAGHMLNWEASDLVVDEVQRLVVSA
jgi:pimeloyl-ACP methyl ester carboxylesterase